MNHLPNSMQSLDVACMVHPQTNLRKHLDVGPNIITRSEGIYIYNESGEKFLEGASGLWCASLGFANQRLAQVAANAMTELGFYQTFRHNSTRPAIQLCSKLLSIAPPGMSKVLLQCSGSEANDTAIKLVWYFWESKGQPKRRKIISRKMAYHGSGIITASMSGRPEMYPGFGLPLPGFLHTEFPHYYRFSKEGETEEEFSSRMAAALEELILQEGPETIGAFFAEPVMGAGGAVVPPKGYFEKIQSVIKKYDILFVVDEVICAFGRTGNMWGSQTFNLQPDMISCAKALAAGMQPISALLINNRIFEAMVAQSERHNSFAHGYTYAGHPVAAAVALETLAIYEELDIVNHVKRVEGHFSEMLRSFRNDPIVGDSQACGLIGALEIIPDKKFPETNGVPFDLPNVLDQSTRAQGLITRVIGNRIALAPPLIITDSEIDAIEERLRLALEHVRRRLAS